jgi:hypothetical protein
MSKRLVDFGLLTMNLNSAFLKEFWIYFLDIDSTSTCMKIPIEANLLQFVGHFVLVMES